MSRIVRPWKLKNRMWCPKQLLFWLENKNAYHTVKQRNKVRAKLDCNLAGTVSLGSTWEMKMPKHTWGPVGRTGSGTEGTGYWSEMAGNGLERDWEVPPSPSNTRWYFSREHRDHLGLTFFKSNAFISMLICRGKRGLKKLHRSSSEWGTRGLPGMPAYPVFWHLTFSTTVRTTLCGA